MLRRPTAARLPAAPGEAQLALAGLRVTEMLADDSNHRAQLMDALAGPAAAALAAPVPEFESAWCGGAPFVPSNAAGCKEVWVPGSGQRRSAQALGHTIYVVRSGGRHRLPHGSSLASTTIIDARLRSMALH